MKERSREKKSVGLRGETLRFFLPLPAHAFVSLIPTNRNATFLLVTLVLFF